VYLAPADLGGQEGVAHDTDAQVERLYLRLRTTGAQGGGDEKKSYHENPEGEKEKTVLRWVCVRVVFSAWLQRAAYHPFLPLVDTHHMEDVRTTGTFRLLSRKLMSVS